VSVRVAARFLPLLALQACGGDASAKPIIALDTLDPARIAQCVKQPDQRQVMSCLIGYAPNWGIHVSTDKIVSGFLVPDAPPPSAVVKVLQDVVDQCGLGAAFLQGGTDFQAMLWVGNPDLSATQIDCIRTKERPGIWLEKETY
jgi:hypothetical protein